MYELLLGDSKDLLDRLEPGIANAVITSPPYFGKRDYGEANQIGLEGKIEDYLDRLTSICSSIYRVLRSDGTFWLNLDDGYNSPGPNNHHASNVIGTTKLKGQPGTKRQEGYKPKDLLGIPWQVAFRLQSAGWYWRSVIIWEKPNVKPDGAKDRPTISHEYILMFSKSQKYFYDHEAVKERAKSGGKRNLRTVWTIPTEPSRGDTHCPIP